MLEAGEFNRESIPLKDISKHLNIQENEHQNSGSEL